MTTWTRVACTCCGTPESAPVITPSARLIVTGKRTPPRCDWCRMNCRQSSPLERLANCHKPGKEPAT